jgi:hypothetical protein
MVKTVAEFKEDMKALRQEMYQNAETADLKLIASWVDKLVMSLEDLSETIELMSQGMEEVSDAEPLEVECACPCCCEPMKAPKKAKTAKKAKPVKKSKPAKKKKRR